MKMRFVMVILMALAAWPALAANEEMRKLDWLVGEWKGEAVVQMGPRTEYALQHERVQSKLDGRVLLVEGVGRHKLEDGTAGEVVHSALAVLSWNAEKKHYRFSTYLADKPGGEAVLEVTGPTSAVWGFDTPRGKVRYTISLTDKGEWLEIGERSSDGVKWNKFIEMRLQKVN
jgi:hypothetical protein